MTPRLLEGKVVKSRSESRVPGCWSLRLEVSSCKWITVDKRALGRFSLEGAIIIQLCGGELWNLWREEDASELFA